MDSILNSIKKLLGIDEFYEHFDVDIIIGINSAFMKLNQLGVGPEEGFVVLDKTQTWSSFVGDRIDLGSIKLYVYLNARLSFDPPQMGYLVDAITKQMLELEWRINVQVENQDRTSSSVNTYIWLPSVSASGKLSWTLSNSKSNPEPVDIMGPQGENFDPTDLLRINTAIETLENTMSGMGNVIDDMENTIGGMGNAINDLENTIGDLNGILSARLAGEL